MAALSLLPEYIHWEYIIRDQNSHSGGYSGVLSEGTNEDKGGEDGVVRDGCGEVGLEGWIL